MSRFKRYIYDRSKSITRQNIYEFIDQQLSDAKEGDVVLNVGSGGDVEKTIRRRQAGQGFTVVTVDISPDRNPDIVADIVSFRSSQNFTYVVMSEVLEHIPEPKKAIDNVYSLLVGGGKLVLTTPFIYPLHDRPHDYYRYTKYGLSYLLKDFSCCSIVERSGWLEAVFAIQARVVREATPHRLLKLSLGVAAIVLYPIAVAVSRMVRTDYVTSGYLVTCEKAGEVNS